MAQVEYFFSSAALASRTERPSSVISLLSYSKNSGFSGEVRLMSSSYPDSMLSSLTGSGGTIVGSATGSGGDGGRDADPVVPGGGAGRGTGAFFPPHAMAATANATNVQVAAPRAAVRISI